jgi:hypothetical protein
MKQIIADNETQLNLLGLILKNYFISVYSGENQSKKDRLGRIKGSLAIKAGEMGAFVNFGDSIAISNFMDQKEITAWIQGDLSSFVGIMAHKGLFRYVLNRRIKFGGCIFLLLKMLRILR